MPDYLGADQRKVRKEEEKDEKPIQGIYLIKVTLIAANYKFLNQARILQFFFTYKHSKC